MENQKLKKGYTLTKRLGKGSFGEVFLATKDDDQSLYAAKVESRRKKDGTRRRGPSQLEYEYRVYQMLDDCEGTPRVYDYFTERSSNGSFNVLVMQRLGRSIQDVVEERGGSLPAKIVLAIGARVLRHLQDIHNKGIIHRDLKPQNLMLSKEASNQVYLIDFGLSKRIIDSSGKHIPFFDRKSGLTGTPRFASVSSHLACEQGRRDDLESLIYILVYLRSGRLPWQGVKGERKERYKKIMNMKRRISDQRLAQGWPAEFADFVREIRCLGFSEKPNYDALYQLLIDAHDSLS